MSMVNIGGDANDASYRYQMPKLITKIEGRGNGIKTVIVNMVAIAKALHVSASYPTKFFGFELGAQSKFNESTERAIVNGSHNAPDLAKVLDKFIDKYILCPRCKLPEIKQKCNLKRNQIEIDCAACGHNDDLKWNHKLVTFIFKDQKEKKKNKKDKKNKDKKDKAKNDEEKKEATSARSEKREDTAWFTDCSKEAQLKRRDQEYAEIVGESNTTHSIGESDKDRTPVSLLKNFISKRKKPSVDDIFHEVRRLQLARGLDEPQKVKILLEAIIDISDQKKVPQQYRKHTNILKRFAYDQTSKTLLIYCIEDQVGLQNPRLLHRIPMILQELYDGDVLDEDTIIAWADSSPEQSWMIEKKVAEDCRTKATPFVDWLKEAEEEGDDDDDDDDD